MEKIVNAVGLFVVALLLLLAGGAIFVQSSLPSASTTANVPDLGGDVRVYRDSYAIPHIFADNLDDAALALGYLHASDRLFQMQMTKRAAEGRLAELLGADLIQYDTKMRALNFAQLAKSSYAALDDETQGLLTSYAEGVNLYLEKHRGAWPLEFLLLGFQPEPWQPSDGLLWAKMMSWQLGGNFNDEILRAQLKARGVSDEEIKGFYPAIEKHAPTTMAPLQWIEKGVEKNARTLPQKNAVPLAPISGDLKTNKETGAARFFEQLPKQASNIFVVDGTRTASGKPLLANDPHLQLQTPALWYLARIVTPDYELKGATAPGLPVFLLGQNGHTAWGFTTSNIDVQDLVFVPDTLAMESRVEKIAVKGGQAMDVTVRSINGYPVLSDVMDDVKTITPEGHVAVLLATLFEPHDRTAQALAEINRARTVKNIEAALDHYQGPPQNLMAADNDGAIAYYAAGALPERKVGDGFMPQQAEKLDVWRGTKPVAAWLRLINPPAHVLLNANNAQDDTGPVYSSAEPYRAMRLEKVLKNASGLTADSAAHVMLDVQSEAARRLKPLLLGVVPKEETDLRIALEEWDGSMLANDARPLIYNVWLQELTARVFGDAMANEGGWPRAWALEERMTGISEEINRAAYEAAMIRLAERFGVDRSTWRWGNVHRAELAHPVWSRVPLANSMFALGVETDGDNHTLQRAAPASTTGWDAFADGHGAGYRAVYDLADPGQSRFVLAGGQSGQPLSPHYGSLVPLWATGKFIALTGDAAAFQKAPDLLLKPGK